MIGGGAFKDPNIGKSFSRYKKPAVIQPVQNPAMPMPAQPIVPIQNPMFSKKNRGGIFRSLVGRSY